MEGWTDIIFHLVSAMLTETRQYYTLYNSLEDQRVYMEKEVKVWFMCVSILLHLSIGWNIDIYP